MNSDIVKKYDNTSIEISDCVFLKHKYSEDLNEAKKGVSTKNASIPEVKAGKEKVNKLLTAQEVLKYAEKYNDAILLMEDDVMHKSKRNGQKVFSKSYDFMIALNAMKKINEKLDKTVNKHLSSYAKTLHKRKLVTEEDERIMNNNLNTCNRRHKIRRAKEACKEKLSESSNEIGKSVQTNKH
eukprot:7680558-Ditylum_brightwellii.AAC.1